MLWHTHPFCWLHGSCIGRRSLKQQGTSAFQVLLACLGTQGEAVWLFRFCPGYQPPVFAQFDLWSTFNLINKSQVGVSVVCGSVWAGWWNPPTLKLGPMSSRDLLPLILSFLQGKRGAQSWVSLPVHGRWPRLALVWHQSVGSSQLFNTAFSCPHLLKHMLEFELNWAPAAEAIWVLATDLWDWSTDGIFQ